MAHSAVGWRGGPICPGGELPGGGHRAGWAPQRTRLLVPHCHLEGRGLTTSACVWGESGTPGGAGPAPSQARLTPSQVSGGAVPLTQEGPSWAGCLGGTELRGLPLFRGGAKSLGPLGQPLLHSGHSTGFQANLWVPQASPLLIPALPLGSGLREAACFLESPLSSWCLLPQGSLQRGGAPAVPLRWGRPAGRGAVTSTRCCPAGRPWTVFRGTRQRGDHSTGRSEPPP